LHRNRGCCAVVAEREHGRFERISSVEVV